MVIFMDIKPLIIAGFVLVLLNSSGGHPLYHQREPRNSVLQGRMTMLRKSCIDSVGNMGICMFKWDCISQQGITLSTCVDGFLFGACCSVKDDSQGNWFINSDYESTTNNQYESTTDNYYEESNTVSVIEYETLSSLVQNLNVSNLKESGLTDDFFAIPNITPDSLNEIYKYDENVTVTESNDKSTFSKGIFEDSNTVNDISSNPNLLNAKFGFDARNSTNNIYFINESIDFEVSDVENTENSTDIELKSNSNLGNSVIGTKINSFKVNRTKNAMTESGENGDFSIHIVSNEKSHMNAKNESLKSEEYVSSDSATVDIYNTTENYFSSEITHNLETDSSTIQTFQSDSKNTEFETIIGDELVFDMDGDFVSEIDNVKTNISSVDNTKDIENFVTEGIDLPVWGNNLSIFPPSFQYLISQLTSKEIANSDTTKNPIIQPTGTLFMNERDKTTIPESVINNKPQYTSDLEMHNVENDSFVDESDVVIVTNEMNSHTNHKSTLNSDNTYAEIFNSTITISPEIHEFVETASNNLYTGITKISVNVSDEIFSPSFDISSEEIHPVKFKEQRTTDASVSVTNNILDENSLSFFQKDKEENYFHKENFTTTYSSTENTEQILFSSTENDVVDSTVSNNYQLNFVSNEYEIKPIYDKNSEIEIIQETTFTRLIDESSTTNKPNQDITTTNRLTDVTTTNHLTDVTTTNRLTDVTTTNYLTDISSDNEDNIDQNVNINENSDIKTGSVLSLSTASMQSTIHSQEFLFDITTDILKFFSKPEMNNIDSSNHKQTNYFPSSSASEQNVYLEPIVKDVITPSQTYTQEVYDTTFESTVSEMLDSFPNKHFFSVSTEIISENTQNMPIPQTDTFIKESSIHSFSEHGSLDNIRTTESWNSTNFSTTENVLNEETVSENSELNESSSDFGEYSTSDTILPVTNESDNFVSEFVSKLKSNYTSLDDYTLVVTKFSDLTTDAINHFQALNNGTSETSSNSFVNSSTSLVTDKTSFASTVYNYANDTTNSPSVDVFDNTKQVTSINTVHNKTTSSPFSIHTDLISNSTKSSESTSTISSTLSTKTQPKPIKEYTWNYKKDCGVRPMQPVGRIVGGRNTYFGKWPWQALVKEATWLGLFVKNKCGGVLITSKYVLTAAHCQPGFLASLLVVLGTHDISNLKDNGLPVIRNVKRMVVHRHYNAQTFENDLALLEMDTELEFMPHVVPICLPHRNEDFTGEMAFVTGWGKLTHGGDVPNILQEVQVPIVANDECQKMFYQAGHQKVIQNNFVCAGYTNGGQDSCEGDSGGPLMVQRKDKRWVLVGTVSHGIGCADPNLPGVYMRMSSYRPWIDSIINK